MTDQTSEHVNAPDLEEMDSHSRLARRRLLKGAATVAPVILTLRSGAAQAAVSACTADPRLRTNLTISVNKRDGSGCKDITGEVLQDGESCLDAYGVDKSKNKTYCGTTTTFKFCPEGNAIYSANAVSSVRCPDL